jgi:hypothetical protein
MGGIFTADERRRIRGARQGFSRVSGWRMWASLVRRGRIDDPRFVPLARIYLEHQQRAWGGRFMRYLRWYAWFLATAFVVLALLEFMAPGRTSRPASVVISAVEASFWLVFALLWPRRERRSRARIPEMQQILAGFDRPA